MSEECFQIISGIVYPRIEFVARSIQQRFGLSRAPRGIRRRKRVIIRAIVQSQLVPTLDRDPKIRPYRPKLWPNTEYRVKEHVRFFIITRKTENFYSLSQNWLWIQRQRFISITKMQFNKQFILFKRLNEKQGRCM